MQTLIVFSVLSPNTFQELGEIQVVGMFADPAWHGHPETTIDKAFQKMSDDYNYKQCYVSNTNRLARANIDIEPAVVHQVIILNRGDCCGEYAKVTVAAALQNFISCFSFSKFFQIY